MQNVSPTTRRAVRFCRSRDVRGTCRHASGRHGSRPAHTRTDDPKCGKMTLQRHISPDRPSVAGLRRLKPHPRSKAPTCSRLGRTRQPRQFDRKPSQNRESQGLRHLGPNPQNQQQPQRHFGGDQSRHKPPIPSFGDSVKAEDAGEVIASVQCLAHGTQHEPPSHHHARSRATGKPEPRDRQT